VKYRHCIFDLDGTIIDSLKGIQHSFEKAYQTMLGKPYDGDITSKIGPPLEAMIQQVVPSISQAGLLRFVSLFKADYDINGYKKSILYDGILEVLKQLDKAGVRCYIATNKRFTPTRLVVDYLGLNRFFNDRIGTLDQQNFIHKGALLHSMLSENKIDKQTALMVGDTHGDYAAALENGIGFVFAKYGYQPDGIYQNIATTPLEILNFLQ
jgi:phosphoglycolate phosphatase